MIGRASGSGSSRARAAARARALARIDVDYVALARRGWEELRDFRAVA